ncbi:MAG: biotin--[acetyl-CoA-carboxylase] ligase [Treponema sp.]|jgi:BirA family biotin operon repressor/biotin-[acetyl-CoA-carboxylase] ligase|nr:biotin--[acetyl-CoA-carboxylase] ligase [Treponema sp.]
MQRLDLANPYGAPVYRLASVSSTMDEARNLAAAAAPHGTVICADFQTRGRGRTGGRLWLGEAGESLFFTVLFRYGSFAAIPPALTLRTGLALSLAVEAFAPALTGMPRIKWPNDLMVRFPGGARKIAGILTESDGSAVFIGIGVNVAQTGFPEPIRHRAASIAQALASLAEAPVSAAPPSAADTPVPPSAGAARRDTPVPPQILSPESRFTLLKHILARLHRELEEDGTDRGAGRCDAGPDGNTWRGPLEDRLYLKGERVRFIPGGTDSGQIVEGILQGMGPEGELLILPPGAAGPLAFVTGELDVYGTEEPSARASFPSAADN